MALFHFSAKVFSRTSRNTVRAVAYRAGCQLSDSQTGESFDYRHKDVGHVELLLPKEAPEWAMEIQDSLKVDRQKVVQKLVDIVEAPEKRINSQVWREFEFALHRELTNEQNIALAKEFVQDQICSRGMAAQLNFHFDVDEKTKEEKPHCHVLVPTRTLGEDGMGPKEREWNKKELLQELRVQWQNYSNFHLKLHGHDVQIDHRCNKDRGIEMEPQPKRSKKIVEIERKAESKNISGEEMNAAPFTEKAQAFYAVQLRNLYRIVRNPEVVFDIVTKHHTTFMWADAQKVLHRYVDDLSLFQRLESHLQSSKELLLLRPEEHESGKAIYTTRSMLKSEKSLIESAKMLSEPTSHGVEEREVVHGLIKTNEELNAYGGLSQDQIKAIYHLTDKGQLKCVVGIAGAGKTTALKTCQDIWQASGYAVYGLAPTGKAAQNLEKEGIKSSTLHKFLKDFEGGRCQYRPNSVLVLDEAGMVDVERFSELMAAVKQLGVKLIVVGDGAQLQPVEAGPAFRLVTERIGKSELHTVIRQKEDWQKDATVLFGRQETQEAIQTYMDRNHVHIVEEKLPVTKHSLHETLDHCDRAEVVKLYEISCRTSSLIYREMMGDIAKTNPQGSTYALIAQHQDYERYLEWKGLQKSSAAQIITDGVLYRPFLEERCLDATKMAMLFVDPKLDKTAQRQAAEVLLQDNNLSTLATAEKTPGQSVDVRSQTKEVLVQSWLQQFKENPEQSSLMLAFSNRDAGDLNRSARASLKESGYIDRKDFSYTIKREDEDDFGKKHITKSAKDFSVHDRIVFTRNNRSLGVQNGSMGSIISLNKQTILVKMDGDDGKEISFAPKLNPYFDQGWAITIHKSQGTTVDQTYVLASYEMTQNLAYVSMTRHRENVHVFGSNLDFWRPEKLPEVLSKSGEKLSAADYLDANALTKLMQADDSTITKIFTRMSHELEAMGAVSKKAFWQLADHFLGLKRENEIRVAPDFSTSIREEVRADEVLGKTSKRFSVEKESIEQKGLDKHLGDSEHTNNLSDHNCSHKPEESNTFTNLIEHCKQRLYDILERDSIPLTPERMDRISQQAERTASFILHAHGVTSFLPREHEMINFSLRAKYELDRFPEIHRDLMDQGETNAYSAYRIADRLASIEGRLYFDALQKDTDPPFNMPFMAQREFSRYQEQLPHLIEDLARRYSLSETTAHHCAQDLLRCRETHGQDPSAEQMDKMVQIAQKLESKDDNKYSYDSDKTNFLCSRERDLLFRHGLSYDAARDLDSASIQVNKSLKFMQQQMEREREQIAQKELSL